jgi:hypothetical protein
MAADNLTRDAGAQRSTPTGAAAHADLRQSLVAPDCVAIVGQSDDASKTAGRPLKYLRQMGYAGRVYPIISRRAQVSRRRLSRASPAPPASANPSASTVATLTPRRPHSSTASTAASVGVTM